MTTHHAISEPGQGRSWSWFLLALFALHAFLLPSVRAEPVQYCRFGDPARPNAAADFCLGLATSRNTSTGAHDVYLTLTHTRPRRSAVGWTAVGTGDSMTGSLMFIIYGDPASGERPIVSIRAGTGHHQPQLLTRAQMSGGDLRVLRSDWVPATARQSVTASISLVCYSCTLWAGDGAGSGTLSATATAQPWIWAWNKAQAFDVYSYDAHLRMHAHHAGNGGWGRFYVDMARADQSAGAHLPSLPVIRPGVAALGASELPSGLGLAGWMPGSPMLRLHGILMALAFLVAFPAGVVAMRSGSRRAFTYHWMLQALASTAVAGGVAAGLALQREINTVHQFLGLALAGAVGLQAFLGWKHHVDFVRIRRRTYISYAHIWIGRLVMLGGQANLLLGLLLGGVVGLLVGLVAAFIALQSSLLAIWVRRRTKAAEAEARVAKYDVLEAHDDEEEESPFAIASPEEMDIGEEGTNPGEEKR
ncbi:uncharacterized protein LY79DRAFT_377975 [Colletotrichum navitas]|uniref:Integral membrane protein n=1 Tax=Colletotrichum navitas TaxID=681940 RepID=A0AAD8PQS2_9PEZI|nr:uncharacterized protein LY79DRAFT_377975 [Colletotrichum navitas]KAK1574206.1 hypothetical protein LY79DRAFT_377975 [Colletotrichum navitas]